MCVWVGGLSSVCVCACIRVLSVSVWVTRLFGSLCGLLLFVVVVVGAAYRGK